eukprot:sb/3464129/
MLHEVLAENSLLVLFLHLARSCIICCMFSSIQVCKFVKAVRVSVSRVARPSIYPVAGGRRSHPSVINNANNMRQVEGGHVFSNLAVTETARSERWDRRSKRSENQLVNPINRSSSTKLPDIISEGCISCYSTRDKGVLITPLSIDPDRPPVGIEQPITALSLSHFFTSPHQKFARSKVSHTMLVLFLLPIAAVIAEEVIVCLPGIKTFAADASYGDRSYWQCGADGKATLKTCPEGQLYHRRSGRCRTVAKTHPGLLKRATGTSPDLEVLELENTNSNSETLGAIYNARTGRFVTGRNLWGAEVTDANMISQPLVYSNLETYQEQDIDDRVYHLGVKANMALSLLSGMIAVSGTAEYLRNEQVKSEAAAVVMKYTSTRVSETMPLTTPITHKGICEMAAEEGGPTHVVSSLTRGLRAFLKFKKSLSLVDSKEDIGGRLAISINSIPGFAFSGSAWVNINGTEVKNLVGVTVTYYGDATIREVLVTKLPLCRALQK